MNEKSEKHNRRMARLKKGRDKLMESKTEEKGLIIVHTGDGKGKSSSAFGMIMRHIAWGMPCAVVQFIKGAIESGERKFITEHFAEECPFFTMGEGFTWETQDRDRDIEKAEEAWEKAKELIRDSGNRMVLLDEINIALRYDYLDIQKVVRFLLDEKPFMTHVVLTGRNALPELLEIADLATEMKELAHPFKDGVMAQKGVEY